ncbi:unnamed protein product [Ectocarpus sp. 6 AP-2014]
MANLTNEARTQLKAAVRNFMENTPNVHSVNQHAKRASNTNTLMKYMSQTFCSSGRPLHEGLYQLNFQNLRYNPGLEPDIDVIGNFALSPAHATSIMQTLNRRRGISVTFLLVMSTQQNCYHACLILFDARTRKQHFFNPEAHVDCWYNIAFSNRPSLVEGFHTAQLNEDTWPTLQQSMQGVVDNNHYGLAGNCLLYCTLVGVLCTRFGIGKPKLMGEMIVEALQEIDTYNNVDVHHGINHVGSHMTHLWNWMISMTDHTETMSLPLLHDNSVNTVEMVDKRIQLRDRARQCLLDFPPLPGPPQFTISETARRARLRDRQTQYLQTHPVIHVGHVVAPDTVAERRESIRDAEVQLLRLMFPPTIMCNVVLRTGKLCSRRACVGQPLCWQHKFLTRNHRRTGAGKMRCVAPQHPC